MYLYKNNDKYIGDWKDDLFDGVGIYLFENGDFFYGELKAGKKHGRGIY